LSGKFTSTTTNNTTSNANNNNNKQQQQPLSLSPTVSNKSDKKDKYNTTTSSNSIYNINNTDDFSIVSSASQPSKEEIFLREQLQKLSGGFNRNFVSGFCFFLFVFLF
jgi:hypothetical protein